MTHFRPGIAPTLTVLALLPLLLFLGFWQLGRAEQKRVLLDNYAERQMAAPGLQRKKPLRPLRSWKPYP